MKIGTIGEIRAAIEGLPDDADVDVALVGQLGIADNAGVWIDMDSGFFHGHPVTTRLAIYVGIHATENTDEEEDEDEDFDDSMDGDHETGLRDAGFGTDEDYGYYGDED